MATAVAEMVLPTARAFRRPTRSASHPPVRPPQTCPTGADADHNESQVAGMIHESLWKVP